jgi:hypothetical protein
LLALTVGLQGQLQNWAEKCIDKFYYFQDFDKLLNYQLRKTRFYALPLAAVVWQTFGKMLRVHSPQEGNLMRVKKIPS